MDTTSHSDLAWMLDELVAVPNVLHAVVLSTDGLIIQKSTSLPQEAAEVLAAMRILVVQPRRRHR